MDRPRRRAEVRRVESSRPRWAPAPPHHLPSRRARDPVPMRRATSPSDSPAASQTMDRRTSQVPSHRYPNGMGRFLRPTTTRSILSSAVRWRPGPAPRPRSCHSSPSVLQRRNPIPRHLRNKDDRFPITIHRSDHRPHVVPRVRSDIAPRPHLGRPPFVDACFLKTCRSLRPSLLRIERLMPVNPSIHPVLTSEETVLVLQHPAAHRRSNPNRQPPRLHLRHQGPMQIRPAPSSCEGRRRAADP